MNVILTQDVERLGKMGEILSVKDGYARNFLIPRGWAQLATEGSRKKVAVLQNAQLRQAQMLKENALELASRLGHVSCTIAVTVGNQGKLHGAVTVGDILRALEGKGVTLEKHQLHLNAPIAQLGSHEVMVKLHPEVNVSLKVHLIRK